MVLVLKGAAIRVLAGALCRQTLMPGVLVIASIATLMLIASLICLAQVLLGHAPAGFLWFHLLLVKRNKCA